VWIHRNRGENAFDGRARLKIPDAGNQIAWLPGSAMDILFIVRLMARISNRDLPMFNRSTRFFCLRKCICKGSALMLNQAELECLAVLVIEIAVAFNSWKENMRHSLIKKSCSDLGDESQ
jgi:hypothetical protein